ncbi:unnamed protein product [Polarella glacialis]|uniref:Secreted protein n=1 Tax=Polarella glacialis TaxID=89957 RepID=A0A813HLY4_POLGL|nr:unnamed protein product [Polarella glacialis]
MSCFCFFAVGLWFARATPPSSGGNQVTSRTTQEAVTSTASRSLPPRASGPHVALGTSTSARPM